MKPRIMYIELKTGYADNGPAWIAKVQFSKSGQTIYFNGKAFKKMKGGAGANYYDLETGQDYWISGVKKNGEDRHWYGGGKIMIDRGIVDEYLEVIGKQQLDKTQLECVDILPTDKQKFVSIENEQLQ